MGIQGMHQHIKPYMQRIHMSRFEGRRVGIDGYAWLHRGAVNVASEIHTKADGSRWWDEANKPPPYISFCMSRIEMLRRIGVTPVVVLDGGKLPAKSGTQEARRRRKAEALDKARALLEEGDQAAADNIFSQTLDVTPEMAHELARALSAEGVEFLVAPYEADPQLAFLSQRDESEGGVAAVVTEDSDLIIYGCRELVYKMDSQGHADGFELESLLGGPPERMLQEGGGRLPTGILSFRGFTMEMLRALGVLAGCDFLPSIKGMGFKKAHTLVRKYKNFNIDRVLNVMKTEKTTRKQMHKEYPDEVHKAVQVFCHAAVFDPSLKALVRLQPLPEALLGADVGFLGADLPHNVATGIARGRMHPWPPHAHLPPLPPPRQKHNPSKQHRQHSHGKQQQHNHGHGHGRGGHGAGGGSSSISKRKPLENRTWMVDAAVKNTPGAAALAGDPFKSQQSHALLEGPATVSRKRPMSGGRSSHGAAAPRTTPRAAPIAAAMAKSAAATVLRWRPVTPAASDSTVESIPGDTPEPPRPVRRPGGGAGVGGGGALAVTQPPKFGAEGSQAVGFCEEEDPVETPSSRVRETLRAAAAQRESLACRLAYDLHPGKQRGGAGNEEEPGPRGCRGAEQEGEGPPGGDKNKKEDREEVEEAQGGGRQKEKEGKAEEAAPRGNCFVRWSAAVPSKGREGAPASAAGSIKKRKASSAPGAGGDQQRRISAFMVERGAAGSSTAGQYESVLYKLAHSKASGARVAQKQRQGSSRKAAGKR